MIDIGSWPITCSNRPALGQLSNQWALGRGGSMTQRQQVVSEKNALTVLHGLSILCFDEEFWIDAKPKKSFFIILCLVKVIAEGFGKQVSRMNVFVYPAVTVCLGLFVFAAVHGCGFVSRLSVVIIHNHMASQLRSSSAERSKETPVALCPKLQAGLQKMRWSLPYKNNKVPMTLTCVDLSKTDQHHFRILYIDKVANFKYPIWFEVGFGRISVWCTLVSMSFTKTKDNTAKQ